MRFLFALLLLTGPAFAQVCGPRPDVVAKLTDTYGEELRFGGLQKTTDDAHAVLEVWASPETGTYTVLMSHANGLSCVVAVGTDFFEAIPGKTGSPL
ncbi:MAG: hypothetical protein ACPG4X_15515 [Pikeienuella sp.]|jgi:hypothetical protein